MKKQKKSKQTWKLHIAVGLLLAAVLPMLGNRVFTAADDKETVRVGLYDMAGFQEYDELGNPTGYNIDYLSRVAALAGWEYEYVEVGDFVHGMQMLEDKKIDLLAPCQITPERRERFEYSSYPFGTEYTALVTLTGNDDYSYEDYSNFDGMKVAVTDAYLLTDHFIEYAKEHQFEVKYKTYKTLNETLEALQNGSVDAAVANLMMIDPSYKVLGRFASAPFYYMTWKGNEELVKKLDLAMCDLKNNNAGLENQLSERYFPIYNEQYLSREEEEYAASLEKLTVGYVPGNRPVSFLNEETGEFDGITRRFSDRIQEISGLKFEYVELPYGNITYDYLREQNIAIVSGVEYNSANLNVSELWTSNPYLSMKKVFVAREGLRFDRGDKLKIAIVSGSQTIKSVIKAKYPEFDIVEYNYIGECFEAVKRKDADILMQNQYVVENWLAKPQYESLGVIPVEGLDDEHCFSVVIGIEGPESGIDNRKLISIMNKAITQISQDEVTTIIITETMDHKYSYTFLDFCYRYRYVLGIAALVIGCGIWGWLYILHLKKDTLQMQKEEEEKLLLQQKRYQLIVDKSEEIIYEISLCGETCLVSDKMKDKFGWTFPEEIKNPSVDKLMESWRVHPDDQKKLRESLINMIDENHSSESLIRMQRIDGEYIWCKVARFPLLDNDNILVSIVGKISDVDSEVREREKLKWQTRVDGLTGLLNKKTFMEDAVQFLEKNSSISAGVIFLDLDYFKEINDNLGHIIGDSVIKNVADKLRVVFAGCDEVARFGGDEFCIFLKGIKRSTLEDKLGWAVDKLKDTYTDGGSVVKVTTSIGAVYCMKEDVKFQELLDEADQALYEAKEKGRNQFILKVKN